MSCLTLIYSKLEGIITSQSYKYRINLIEFTGIKENAAAVAAAKQIFVYFQ